MIPDFPKKMKKNKLISLAALLALTLVTAAYIPNGSLYAAEPDPNPPVNTPETVESDDPNESDDSQEPLFPENSVFLNHSEPLRAGEQTGFTYACSGEDVRVLWGSITYDPAQLTFEGAASIDQSWLINLNPSEPGILNFIANSTIEEGSSGVSQLFRLTFKLTEEAAVGDSIAFYLSDATALKGEDELTFTGGVSTFLVDRPISTDCTLTSLTPSAGNLTPAFAPNITEYTLSVGYNCENLGLDAIPADYAVVELSDTTLEVGVNRLTVKVIAESGAEQVYTLTVTRASDPNYIPSSDSRLSGIILSDGMLFPAFSPSITEYTVYLINEGGITLTPAPAALGSAEAAALDGADGSSCTLTSYAENGSSTVYTFTVLRIQPSEEPTDPTDPADPASPNGQGSTQSPNELPFSESAMFLALIAVALVSIFFVGLAVGKLLNKKKDAADIKKLPPVENSDQAPSTDNHTPDNS